MRCTCCQLDILVEPKKNLKACCELLKMLRSVAELHSHVVITGAESCIGREAVCHFATHSPVSLLLRCRNVVFGEAKLRSKSKEKGRISVASLQILAFDSVHKFAEKTHVFLADGNARLRLLVNGAGVVVIQGAKPASGFWVTWRTNLGPFLLRQRLARLRERMQTGRELRVVQTTNCMEQQPLLTSSLPELSESLLERVRGESPLSRLQLVGQWPEQTIELEARLRNLLTSLFLQRWIDT